MSMHNERGFSLIEVLLAMAILSIGLLAVLSLHLNTTRYNTKCNAATMANMIAQKKIEAACTGKIADSNSLLSSATDEGFIIDERNVNSNGLKDQSDGIFTVQTRISKYPDDKNLRKVNVTVLWNIRGASESITYSALTRGSTVEI